MTLDPRTADIIIESLRAGEVPQEGLESFATGIEPLAQAVEADLPRVADGRGRYRFLRGEYGSGKTFFLRLLAARARARGFAATYVRVSYPEVALHLPVEVYRAAAGGLGFGRQPDGALRALLDQWLFDLGERVLDPTIGQGLDEADPAFPGAVAQEVRKALGPVADAAPAMAQVLSAYATASLQGQAEVGRGLLQWMTGDDKVAQQVKKQAHLVGKLSHADALPMLRGLSEVVRQAGLKGLVVVVDEVERLVRLSRGDLRQRGLETLQNWTGALDAGQLPGVLLVVAGTRSFFESPRGVPALVPLQQRIGAFDDGPFPNPESVLLGLPTFDEARLRAVGRRVRDIYGVMHPQAAADCPDAVVDAIAGQLAQAFHGRVEVTPRRYLRELVDVLGRIRQYPGRYDPLAHYRFDPGGGGVDLDVQERAAVAGGEVEEGDLELPGELEL